MTKYVGKLADPEWRRERGRKGAMARQSLDAYVNRIVRDAGELEPAHIVKLRAVIDDAPPLPEPVADLLRRLNFPIPPSAA